MAEMPVYYTSPHIMQVFSASCMAECKYCFGPHKGKIADLAIINNSIDFLKKIFTETGQAKASITFHGGEPLTLPINLWKYYFDRLHNEIIGVKFRFNVQSNLWKLNNEFCDLFYKYNVAIGTSIDGPMDLNDKQRGIGYFNRTLKGIRLAEKEGLDVGCIATFTPAIIDHYLSVMIFFLEEKLSFSTHPSIRPLNHYGNDNLFLKSEQFTVLEVKLLYEYLRNRKKIRIGSLDQYIRSVALGKGEVCTFKDCFGMFIAIGPEGNIYHCQRFCGKEEFCIGNVADLPSLSDIENHPNAKKIIERQNAVIESCWDCEHFNYCKGGCYYNAISDGDGIIDMYCETYKMMFNIIKKLLIEEISSEQNTDAMINSICIKDDRHFFLKKGKLISLIKDQHPYQIAQNAKMVVALHEIAKGTDLSASAKRMFENGITDNEFKTYDALKQIKDNLIIKSNGKKLNNLYVHITFQCNLRCTHCYANAGISNQSTYIDINALKSIIKEARENYFRQTIITGGEPLIHPEITDILLHLKEVKKDEMNLVLRTNLTGEFSDNFLLLIAESFNQIVVSVDGNKNTHDSRRGNGSYEIMKSNIVRYQNLFKDNKDHLAELSLACVMSTSDIIGEPGNSVRVLADELKIKRTRFRPLLPIGRAKDWEIPPTSEPLNSHVEPMSIIENGFRPNLSCGIGQNLYIEPNGDAFPCYAFHKPHSILGNVIKDRLEEVLNSQQFKRLSKYDVDHIEKCQACEYRYLCGGACRAWSGESSQYRLDAPPIECDGLKKRAKEIVDTARNYILDDSL